MEKWMIDYAEFIKKKGSEEIATGFEPQQLGSHLFDFQAAIVDWACKRGRAAIFADTGLGKTAMQSEWARQVAAHTGGRVLILAPLCVAQQTVEEESKFGTRIKYCRKEEQAEGDIIITNYEMVEHFDVADYAGVVLDESSILKSHDSKTRAKIIEMFSRTPYRLSCTATPSPNDHMELGNQAEFLGVMTATEMLAMFFVHDGGDTSQWRLKGHGKTRFWEWMSKWSVCVRNPADLGFDGSRYILPGLQMHEHTIDVQEALPGQLFAGIAQTLTERRDAKRQSMTERVGITAELVNGHMRPAIVWCHLNDESKALAQAIPDAIEVTGSMSADEKERAIMAFTHGEKRVIVTKPSIAGFGMNWQHCADMVFAGLDDSFESFYQAVRRCYRFGQKDVVNVHLVSSSAEGAVKANLERKQAQANDMAESMVSHMRELTKQTIKGSIMEKSDYVREVAEGDGWKVHLGDCVEVASEFADNSIDYSVFSPPFASLYTYSNSDRDMGNCKSYDEFYDHFRFLVAQLFRVTKPGRLLSFHCMNLQTSKFRDGVIGLHDFRGELVRMFTDAGWIFHSEVCIWKDPVTAMQRTKALGLLHKTIRKDSSMSRQGIPDYLVTMRKPGENAEQIAHTHESFPVDKWQKYASPVWMDINPTRTLQYKTARETDDERHICPLQLDVIERAMELWSNPGDLVFSPFTGIGSEGYVSIEMGRRFVGSELKRSYWELAKRNLSEARKTQAEGLFADEFDAEKECA
jgi:superfamily II DNA or RNA helicase